MEDRDEDVSRSSTAIETDGYSERLILQRHKTFAISVCLLVAAIFAVIYFRGPSWAYITLAIMWLGYLINDYGVALLHELYELNDQISGRKDEFRRTVKKSNQGGGDAQ